MINMIEEVEEKETKEETAVSDAWMTNNTVGRERGSGWKATADMKKAEYAGQGLR